MTTKIKEKGSPSSAPANVAIRPNGPFDLGLSLKAAASFFPEAGPPPPTLKALLEIDGETTLLEVCQSSASGVLHAKSTPALPSATVRAKARWLVSADLDLRPFYALSGPHPVMGAAVRSLHGLKPLRPASLLEMAVVAITEQQLSLAAAFHIRARLVRRFGAPFGDLVAFPSAKTLAEAPLGDLCACGLSQRKAEYVRDFALRTGQGALNFEALRHSSDERIRAALISGRGFGEWSADYILGRGFGRQDSLPAADSGLRRVVGRYFAGGRSLTPAGLAEALAPFKPFRGLAAYYLAVHWRLRNAKEAPLNASPNLDPQFRAAEPLV